MVCCPRLATARQALSECSLWQSITSISSVMEPCSFKVPSTLCTGIGRGSGVVSNLLFCMKSQLMNIPVAPESRSAVMDMGSRDVTGVIWTESDMACGGPFERTYILSLLSSDFFLGYSALPGILDSKHNFGSQTGYLHDVHLTIGIGDPFLD